MCAVRSASSMCRNDTSNGLKRSIATLQHDRKPRRWIRVSEQAWVDHGRRCQTPRPIPRSLIVLLVGVGELQQCDIGAGRADQLHAHRQTAVVETDRHADRRQPRERGVERDLHPSVVRVHRPVADVIRPALLDRERPHLGGREHEHVVALEHCLDRDVVASANLRRAVDVVDRERPASIDLPQHLRLHLGAPRDSSVTAGPMLPAADMWRRTSHASQSSSSGNVQRRRARRGTRSRRAAAARRRTGRGCPAPAAGGRRGRPASRP